MSARLPSLRPGDTLNIAFSLFLLGLTALFYDRIPVAGNLLLLYASLAFFQGVLVFISGYNSFLTLTRDIIFPVLSILIVFDSLGLIVHPLNPHDLDYVLIRIDYLLFGGYPTVFFEKFMHPVLTDILQVAYSTYYFLPVILGVVLKLRGQREDFEYALFLILLCFYLSYVGYLLVPALGPRYAMEHLHERELEGFLVAHPIQNFLNLLEGVKRDAFPSGHTGIALTVLFLSYRFARDLFRLLLVPVLLLILATVYCRYHYAVDVFAGVLLAVVTVASGGVYYRFRQKRQCDQKDIPPCRPF
ncbi:MAG: phosphatase PAP2 family protein [Alphaproteobacteria bacterium]|uniref:Phosphatase PAP2 family protein n=1 Tax=Candidatus Nitrobium versatile TaxID=2884831 RepID=A0A953JAD6_9BACT|nr:phosphatase PAP2 family protein [Candidatus Nitrobium versatile]